MLAIMGLRLASHLYLYIEHSPVIGSSSSCFCIPSTIIILSQHSKKQLRTCTTNTHWTYLEHSHKMADMYRGYNVTVTGEPQNESAATNKRNLMILWIIGCVLGGWLLLFFIWAYIHYSESRSEKARKLRSRCFRFFWRKKNAADDVEAPFEMMDRDATTRVRT